MKLFGPLGVVHTSLILGVGPLTFHITFLDWRMWCHHKVIKCGNVNITRRDYWLGPFRVQYITKKAAKG